MLLGKLLAQADYLSRPSLPMGCSTWELASGFWLCVGSDVAISLNKPLPYIWTSRPLRERRRWGRQETGYSLATNP